MMPAVSIMNLDAGFINAMFPVRSNMDCGELLLVLFILHWQNCLGGWY